MDIEDTAGSHGGCWTDEDELAMKFTVAMVKSEACYNKMRLAAIKIKEINYRTADHLRTLDWVSRHDCWLLILRGHGRMAEDIRLMMGADELLWGGMRAPMASKVIHLPDRTRPIKRQALLSEYFPKRPRL